MRSIMQQSAHAASLLACASAVVLVISATFAKKEVVIGRPVFLADTVGRRARLQLLADETYKWKGYKAPSNVFDDKSYQAPEWKAYKAPSNVFDEIPAEEQGPWKAYAPEVNAYDETPDTYPFDETKGGHEWKKWDEGTTASEMIKEQNALDDGTTGSEAYDLGEHSSGKPYKEFKVDKNVYDSLDTKEPQWGKTTASLPEKNVLGGDYEFPQGR